MNRLFHIFLVFGLWQSTHSAPRPNVLFIAVDDWNDWVGCLGHAQAKTPNVNRLAKRGLLFTNAHCVSPVCNPSRVALMTGLRPGTTGVYENGAVMRKVAPGVVTIPQHFRKHGYVAHGGGKIFHDVTPHYDPHSFNKYYWWHPRGALGSARHGSPYSVEPDPEPVKRPARRITSLTKRNFDWAAIDRPETDWPDGKVADWAAGFLAKKHEQPFFLAVGLFRPHVPWYNPRKFVKRFPLEKIKLPLVKENDLDDLGPWAKARAHDRNSKHDKVVEFGEWKPAVQAYLASISFSDAMLGRVLDALDAGPNARDTLIVFWSDHGYHLGEKGHWHKRTLWERSTRVPLIIVAPGVTRAETRCARPVSLLDLYPTLADLCGLPACAELEGQSLRPLLKNPKAEWKRPAVITWQKGNHAVRSERWRYIRYRTGEEELYDHQTDPNEWNNLANDPKLAELRKQMAKWLPTKNSKPNSKPKSK